jgi:zinc protease
MSFGVAIGIASLALALGCQSGPFARKPAWEQPPPPVHEAPIVAKGALTRVVLDNGLEVMLLEDHRLPLLSMGMSFRRGGAIEADEEAGLALFTAELMNRGAGDLDATELAETVDALGASLGIDAGWDSMSVGISGLSRDSDALLEILDMVVREPRFEPGEAEAARDEQIASIRSQDDDPVALVNRRAMATLYDGHRYGIPLEGTPETVAGLDAGSARDLHARIFMPNNAIFYAVGDFDPESMNDRVAALFEGWEKGEVAAPVAPPPNPTPGKTRIVIADKPDLVQSRILLAHEGISRTDERRIPASLLNAVLGGSGFSARMMKELRSAEGLTYGVSSYFAMRRRPGPFAVSTFTRVPETRRAVDILMAQLRRIRSDEPVSAAELADAKSYSVGQFALGLETSSSVMGSLVNLAIYGLPEDSLDTYRSRVQAVTPDQVRTVAQQLLHPDRIAIVLLGPADALVPQFEGLGDIEVVEP